MTSPTDDHLEALIEHFESTGRPAFAQSCRAIRRAFRITTTDLVGNDNMIGARVTFVDTDGDPHRAIVLEPEVSSIGGKAYDPYKDEIVDPSEYPLGTVQLIRGDGWEFGTDTGFFDRVESQSQGRGLRAETSVTPATSPDDTYCYFAGWDYFDDVFEESEGD